ncbi:MAG: polyprenyl synthetase family protein [Desulfobacterales bacterium]|nr:polyprenyl synthetase family protein [Desulfobacterales bacterium]
MNPFDLKDYLVQRRVRIEDSLKALLNDRTVPNSRVGEAIRYSLLAGGKRLRPILCLAACEAAGGDANDALAAACALELIHTYSLIHDDLPAMDDDALRRGVATCHTKFDEATAIMAGDGMLTLAFEVLSDTWVESQNRFGPSEKIAVIHRVASAAGIRGMVEGQMRDIAAEGSALSLEDLTELHRLKTGVLIEAAVWCGGFLAGAQDHLLDELGRYGRSVGLAFQVTDDILNVAGDPEKLGKSVGTDAKRKKSTYPSLLGLSSSKTWARELVKEAIDAVSGFDHRAEPLRAIARYVADRQR